MQCAQATKLFARHVFLYLPLPVIDWGIPSNIYTYSIQTTVPDPGPNPGSHME